MTRVSPLPTLLPVSVMTTRLSWPMILRIWMAPTCIEVQARVVEQVVCPAAMAQGLGMAVRVPSGVVDRLRSRITTETSGIAIPS